MDQAPRTTEALTRIYASRGRHQGEREAHSPLRAAASITMSGNQCESLLVALVDPRPTIKPASTGQRLRPPPRRPQLQCTTRSTPIAAWSLGSSCAPHSYKIPLLREFRQVGHHGFCRMSQHHLVVLSSRLHFECPQAGPSSGDARSGAVNTAAERRVESASKGRFHRSLEWSESLTAPTYRNPSDALRPRDYGGRWRGRLCLFEGLSNPILASRGRRAALSEHLRTMPR